MFAAAYIIDRKSARGSRLDDSWRFYSCEKKGWLSITFCSEHDARRFASEVLSFEGAC